MTVIEMLKCADDAALSWLEAEAVLGKYCRIF
jgi:hypothetical protein